MVGPVSVRRWPGAPAARAFGALIVLFASGFVGFSAPAATPEKIQISIGAADSTGVIWGSNWRPDAFYKWDGHKWNVEEFAPAAGASPIALERVNGGSVLCLWRFESSGKLADFLLSEHKGQDNRVLARWKASPYGTTRVFRASGATWVTNGREIYRLENGAMRLAYKLAPAQTHRTGGGSEVDPADYDDLGSYNDIEVVEGGGRTYFWSNEWTTGFYSFSIRGLLIYENGRWQHRPHLTGVPDKPYTAFAKRDAKTFWLAVGDQGLYQLDASTLSGKQIPAPVPHAFDEVQKLEQVNGVWNVFSNAPERLGHTGDSSLRESDLWQLRSVAKSGRARGDQWTRVMRGLEYGDGGTSRPTRPLLAERDGLWIAAVPGGVWWLPRDAAKPPILIDWRRGFNINYVRKLIPLRDGRVMAFGGDAGPVADLRPCRAAIPTGGQPVFANYLTMQEDSRHHIWRIPSLAQKSVLEWNGDRWLRHPVPASYTLNNTCGFFEDFRGRIWLLPDYRDLQTALFDPANGSWLVFPNFSAALQQQLRALGPREFAKLKPGNEDYLTPHYLAPGRIAYRSGGERLWAFDGKTWRNWTANQITGQRTSSDDWDGGPFWTKTGVLCVNIVAKTWEWTPARGWREAEWRENPERVPGRRDVTLPPGCGIVRPQAITRDSSGAVWMVKDAQLYKAAWGLVAPQLAPGERHPLRAGKYMSGVLLDTRGNAFLAMGYNGDEEYLYMPGHAPDTRIRLAMRGADALTATFQIRNATGKHWFRWRLDGGKWSAPQTEETAKLEWQASGRHLLEAAAINAKLELDPTPARCSFVVSTSPQTQFSRLLEMLRSPAFADREMAIKAFARQPASVLKTLNEARRTADEETRWWIDAAIQEVENARPTFKKEPAPH